MLKFAIFYAIIKSIYQHLYIKNKFEYLHNNFYFFFIVMLQLAILNIL